MKKILVLFLTIMLFIACDRNREKLSEDNKRWKLLFSQHNGNIDKEENTFVDFDSDGDLIITSENKISKGNFKTKGNDSIKIELLNEEGVLKGTFRFTDNKLKIEGIVKTDTIYWELVDESSAIN